MCSCHISGAHLILIGPRTPGGSGEGRDRDLVWILTGLGGPKEIKYDQGPLLFGSRREWSRSGPRADLPVKFEFSLRSEYIGDLNGCQVGPPLPTLHVKLRKPMISEQIVVCPVNFELVANSGILRWGCRLARPCVVRRLWHLTFLWG